MLEIAVEREVLYMVCPSKLTSQLPRLSLEWFPFPRAVLVTHAPSLVVNLLFVDKMYLLDNRPVNLVVNC